MANNTFTTMKLSEGDSKSLSELKNDPEVSGVYVPAFKTDTKNYKVPVTNLSDGSNVKFAGALSEIDLTKADMKIYRDRIQNPTMEYSKLYIKNEHNSDKTYTMVDTDAASGFLFKLESGPIISQEIQIPEYEAGDGININNDEISWEYTVGRNLHINQNNQIQTNLPGGIYDAPTDQSNSFTRLTGANFAGAYMLACRHNPNDTYEIAIVYTASGPSSTITFIGTETVIGINNNITVNPAAYIGETTYYTPMGRFGYNTSTIFDPTVHKAIIYQGLAQIGPTSNTQIAIWQDNGVVKISFTSIEVGKVGSMI